MLRGEQEVDENNLRLPDLDEEDEDEEEEDEDDLDGDDFGDQGPRGGGGMVGGMGQRRPGGLGARMEQLQRLQKGGPPVPGHLFARTQQAVPDKTS